MQKPFHALTTDEAVRLALFCKLGAVSVEEIRRKLTEAGFNGEAASITSHSERGHFLAMIMVMGPSEEIIIA